MGKITLSMYVSLDGVVEDPAWTMPYWNDDIAQFKSDEMFASDALLLGRVTYKGFAKAWPAMKDEPGADRMNSVPKFVASRTLHTMEWNATLIQGDVVEEVARLKQSDQRFLIYGSADFDRTLMQHDLIDEYRLLVYPVVLGSGKRLFKEGIKTTLKLVETRSFASGVVLLTYHPERKG